MIEIHPMLVPVIAAVVIAQFVAGIAWGVRKDKQIERLEQKLDDVVKDQAKSDTVVAIMGNKLDSVLLGNARIEEQIKTLFDMVRSLSK